LLAASYPVQMICSVLGLAASSYYYRPSEKEELALVTAIQELAAKYPSYGSRRIAAMLRRTAEHPLVNRKRVQRIMREEGLLCRRKRAARRTTNSRHGFARFENLVVGLVIERPNQVWVSDLTYIKLGNREFVYLAIVMDVFTRSIRGWSLSRGLGVDLSLAALQKAFSQGAPELHHSDQGVQYACPGYVEELRSRQVRVSMAEVGQAQQNGYAERVIRTIKEEEVYLNEYADFEEAMERIGDFIEAVYNRKRIHSRLGYLTPIEFEAQWRKQMAASKKNATQSTLQI
jgi:putative transposase